MILKKKTEGEHGQGEFLVILGTNEIIEKKRNKVSSLSKDREY